MNSAASPPANKRVHIIDAIRGLAILGILFANIHSWSGYKYIALSSIAALPLYELDAVFRQLHYCLVDGKFYAIFSMLFGAGFGLQYVKNQHNQAMFVRKYRRRLCFLLMFGLLHALLWSGDILTLYALLAFVLVQVRNIPYQRLLPFAVFLLCFFALPQVLVLLLAGAPEPPPALAHKNFVGITPQDFTDSFGTGDWADVFAMNLHGIYWRWQDMLPNGRISRVLGLFVLGFYLARSGYFNTAIYSGKRLLLYATLGVGAIWLVRYTGTNITQWSASGGDVLLKMVLVSGQVFLALAYMSLLALAYRNKTGEMLLYPLTLVGRMAFTSYLLQTVIGMAIFYGVGFGLWATMGLAQLWLLSLVIFLGQAVMCSIWLRFFRQGPVEWLWGCLTAGKISPNRLTA